METDRATTASADGQLGESVSSRLDRVLIAANVAAALHKGQRRKYTDIPYINHPLRVAGLAARAGLSVDAVAAGALHDVLEDCDTTADDLRMVVGISERTVDLVRVLTKDWDKQTPADRRLVLELAYYGRITGDPEAAALKVLDRTDNICEMHDLLSSVSLLSVHGRFRQWARDYVVNTTTYVLPLVRHLRTPAWVADNFQGVLDDLAARTTHA